MLEQEHKIARLSSPDRPGILRCSFPLGDTTAEISLDAQKGLFGFQGRLTRLTPQQTDLMAYFISHQGQPTNLRQLSEVLYGHASKRGADAAKCAVFKLQKKVNPDQQVVQNIYKRGYMIPAVETQETQQKTNLSCFVPLEDNLQSLSLDTLKGHLTKSPTLPNGHEPVQLSPLQTKLLKFLMNHQGEVVDLVGLNIVLYGDTLGEQGAKFMLFKLKNKLGDKKGQIIQTIPGFGYRIPPLTESAPEYAITALIENNGEQRSLQVDLSSGIVYLDGSQKTNLTPLETQLLAELVKKRRVSQGELKHHTESPKFGLQRLARKIGIPILLQDGWYTLPMAPESK